MTGKDMIQYIHITRKSLYDEHQTWGYLSTMKIWVTALLASFTASRRHLCPCDLAVCAYYLAGQVLLNPD